jgi:dienelactone hydrolase
MRNITSIAAAVAMTVLLSTTANAQDAGAVPQRVDFASADGKTTLVGYVFAPARKGDARVPAVVMMHGRSGAYSTLAKGRYDGSTLAQRHLMWGRFWAEQGYVALMVDSFMPRGYPQGFPRNSYKDRPDELNEVTVRPLDAYGALTWLRTRADVAADRIALQGWSNGGTAALATMAAGAGTTPASLKGFSAALVFYPGCTPKVRFRDDYRPYAPVRVFHGTADEEVSYRFCQRLVEKSRALGGNIEITLYPHATHDFDAPIRSRQSVKANAEAKADSMVRAQGFLAQQLGEGQPAR